MSYTCGGNRLSGEKQQMNITMERTGRLSSETRRCPRCRDAAMRATRMGLGGGWSKTGVRFVFSCAGCGHETVLENRRTRRLTAIAGGVLVIASVGLVLAIGAVVAILFGLLGIGAIIVSLAPERRYPVTGHLPEDQIGSVEIEDFLYLSDDEKARGGKWQTRGQAAIYAVLALTAAWLAWSFISDGW